MNTTRTPAEIASVFGCSVEQAKTSMCLTAIQLREMGEKARKSKTGKYRGFTAEYLFQKAASFEASISK